MKQVVIGFGLLVAALPVLFKLAEYSHWQSDDRALTWVIVFCAVFFVIGIILSRKQITKKIIIKEEKKEAALFIDEDRMKKTGISKRELEILKLIDDGLSNQKIADRLFLSEHTVKKHVSNLFFKLDVQRRTEAVKKAKTMRLIG